MFYSREHSARRPVLSLNSVVPPFLFRVPPNLVTQRLMDVFARFVCATLRPLPLSLPHLSRLRFRMEDDSPLSAAFVDFRCAWSRFPECAFFARARGSITLEEAGCSDSGLCRCQQGAGSGHEERSPRLRQFRFIQIRSVPTAPVPASPEVYREQSHLSNLAFGGMIPEAGGKPQPPPLLFPCFFRPPAAIPPPVTLSLCPRPPSAPLGISFTSCSLVLNSRIGKRGSPFFPVTHSPCPLFDVASHPMARFPSRTDPFKIDVPLSSLFFSQSARNSIVYWISYI